MGNSVNNEAAREIDIKEWVVVKTTGSGGYLGRVKEQGLVLSRLAGQGTKPYDDFKEKILGRIAAEALIPLNPCFDFMAPLRPIQHPQTKEIVFQRDPVIVPFDFTTQPTTVYAHVSSVMFCGDLQSPDVGLYMNFIQQSLDQALRARAQHSGLALVGADGLPVPPAGRG